MYTKNIIEQFLAMNPEKGPLFIVAKLNSVLDQDPNLREVYKNLLTDQEVENMSEDWRHCYKAVLSEVKGQQSNEAEESIKSSWGEFLALPTTAV